MSATMIASLCPVSDALDDLDQQAGWRALFVLPPEAADADALVSALPWVQDGAPRQGTTVRIFQVKDDLLLVTGGALSDEEGAYLFELHDKLKDIATRVYIVPPMAAPPSLIERMYDARLAPTLPTDKLPSTRLWAGIAAVVLTFGGVMLRFSANREIVSFEARVLMYACVVLIMLCGVMWLRNDRKASEMRADSLRVTATRWTPICPPFIARRTP